MVRPDASQACVLGSVVVREAALAAANVNGKKLGNYQRIAEANQRATAARPEAVLPAIAETLHVTQEPEVSPRRRGLPGRLNPRARA